MVYAEDLKSLARKGLWVRLPPCPPRDVYFHNGYASICIMGTVTLLVDDLPAHLKQ